MTIRRSIFLSVCCYIILFSVLKNLNVNFKIQQQQLLSGLQEADEQVIGFENREFFRFHRRLTEMGNGVIGTKTIEARIDTAGKLIVDVDNETPKVINTFELETNHSQECRLENNIPKAQYNDQLKKILNNCDFVREHGYLDFPVTSEEKEYPLAFAIKMHQNAEQAEQLLRTIYRKHNVYCIHVDKKADAATFDIMKRIGECLPNVVVVMERETVVYASSALVRAELKCMKTVLDVGINWKYYINLAAQEFPLRTNLEIVKILKEMKGANDIETYDHPVYLDWRIQKSYLVTGNSLAETGKKILIPYKINISKGSAYGLFTRNFIDFILHDRIAKEIIQYFNDTFAPEENVWATLNTLPWAPGGYSMEVRHLLGTFVSRAMIWSGDSPRCHGNFVRSVCIFKSGDYPWLVKKQAFFANKFDRTIDPNILNCLESWYKARAYNKTTSLDWKYYFKLPHIKFYRNLGEFRKSKTYLLTVKRKWNKVNTVSKIKA